MKNINIPMLLLAILVITLFSGVGVAIAYKSIIGVILCLLLAFTCMGYGISLKIKANS